MDPAELLERLIELVAREDIHALGVLCRAEKDLIVASIPEWQSPPQAVRDDPARLERYATGLFYVARYLAERMGEPRPLQRLTGEQVKDPFPPWYRSLDRALKLAEEEQFEEAEGLILSILDHTQERHGHAWELGMARLLEALSRCRFHLGRAREAIGPLEDSLRLLEAHSDDKGIHHCLCNLVEMNRWLGESGRAADWLERLAQRSEAQGDAAETAALRREVRRLREGEPLCRVVYRAGNRTIDVEALPDRVPDGVDVVVLRHRITLRPAKQRIERGRGQVAKGEFEAAIESLREAHRLDSYDPDAPYLEGVSLLHLRRYSEGVERLQRAEGLAPGWPGVGMYLRIARQLESGAIGHGAFLAIRMAEDDALPPERKLEAVEGAIRKAPSVARLHFIRGDLLRQMGRRRKAEASLREALALADEPEVRWLATVYLGCIVANPVEGERLLQEARDQKFDMQVSAYAELALRARR